MGEQEPDNCLRTLSQTFATFLCLCVWFGYCSLWMYMCADNTVFFFFLSFKIFPSVSPLSYMHAHKHTATSSAHLEDLAYLDEQRHTPLRTSLRMPRQSTTCGPGRSGQDLRGETQTELRSNTHTQPLLRDVKQHILHRLCEIHVTDILTDPLCLK